MKAPSTKQTQSPPQNKSAKSQGLRLAGWLYIPLAIAYLGISSCQGWQMDYGKPAAQFEQESLQKKGAPFVGKKITVRGTVDRVDTSDPKNAYVYLKGGIRCNFGDFTAMAKDLKVGDIAFVDGFLTRCEPGDIVIEPALSRDPTAPFSPL